MMYVVGGGEENEVLLYSVVLCLRDALGILLKCVSLFSRFSSFSFPFPPARCLLRQRKADGAIRFLASMIDQGCNGVSQR